MKHIYVAPEITVIEIETESLMLSVSGANGGLDGTEDGGLGYEKEADANGRRGSWGNLWEDGRRW